MNETFHRFERILSVYYQLDLIHRVNFITLWRHMIQSFASYSKSVVSNFDESIEWVNNVDEY